nr:unnamed protein product [Mus musculus]
MPGAADCPWLWSGRDVYCASLLRLTTLCRTPPLGTVVDSEATRPEWYDFYLISQTANRGTVSPTHYNVIYDDNALKPDHMQRLTFKLCHLYYNWQSCHGIQAALKPVTVPLPQLLSTGTMQ